MSSRTKILIAGILIAALARVVPHPPNFAPMTALGLFGGAYLSRRWLGFFVPLLSMVLGDCFFSLPAPCAHGYGSPHWLAGRRRVFRASWAALLCLPSLA